MHLKAVKSEMAGTVLELKVKAGDTVSSGQELLVMESMKMEVPVLSPQSGKVKAVSKSVGDFVNEGETLLEIE